MVTHPRAADLGISSRAAPPARLRVPPGAGQAPLAQLPVGGPRRLVERAPGGRDRSPHFVARRVGDLTDDFLGGRVHVVEGAGFAVDELAADQQVRLVLRVGGRGHVGLGFVRWAAGGLRRSRLAEAVDGVGVHPVRVEPAGDQVTGAHPATVHVPAERDPGPRGSGCRRDHLHPFQRVSNPGAGPGRARRTLAAAPRRGRRFTTGTQYSGRRPARLVAVEEPLPGRLSGRTGRPRSSRPWRSRRSR